MHLRGKDMTFSVTYPDGREEILLNVPKYSFNWQLIYALENPLKIPAGSVLRATPITTTHRTTSSTPPPIRNCRGEPRAGTKCTSRTSTSP